MTILREQWRIDLEGTVSFLREALEVIQKVMWDFEDIIFRLERLSREAPDEWALARSVRELEDALHALAWAQTQGERAWARARLGRDLPEPEDEDDYALRPSEVLDPEEVEAARAQDDYLEFWYNRFRL